MSGNGKIDVPSHLHIDNLLLIIKLANQKDGALIYSRMHKIRILAVEDEALHADVLRMVIEEAGYELIDIVDNSRELFGLLEATHPDLLLMDIDLGEELTGIDIVRKVNEITDIPVIYLTSFREERIFRAAKETLPDAYLTKPYNPLHLQSAIELAFFKKQKENTDAGKWRKPVAPPSNSVFVKEGNTLVKVLLNDIQLVEAYDKYCFIHTIDKKHLLSVQLKSLIESLPSEQFIQVHRSYLINLNALEKVRLNQNSLEVAGKLVPVSKTYKNSLFSHLHML